DPSHSFDIASSEFHSLKIDSEINPNGPVTIFVPKDSAFTDAVGYIVLPVENKYFTWQCHMLSGYSAPPSSAKLPKIGLPSPPWGRK
ncbi:hypothetical protein L195_g062257, partial [Trifolium pratense]